MRNLPRRLGKTCIISPQLKAILLALAAHDGDLDNDVTSIHYLEKCTALSQTVLRKWIAVGDALDLIVIGKNCNPLNVNGRGHCYFLGPKAVD